MTDLELLKLNLARHLAERSGKRPRSESPVQRQDRGQRVSKLEEALRRLAARQVLKVPRDFNP